MALYGYEPKNIFTAIIAPTANDDLSLAYEKGSEWTAYNGTIYSIYKCVDPVRGAAVWTQLA